MKILFLSHEVAPWAKVGGLADVAGSLPKALRARGHDVRILMPGYRMVLENPGVIKSVSIPDLEVAINPVWSKSGTVFQAELDEVPVYLLGDDEWFSDTVSSETIYLPGSSQHLFFSRAALAMCEKLGWIPDVIHCHDWHTGLTPVMIREADPAVWGNTASVFTIHNLAYQGEFPFEILGQAGLDERLYNMHELETYGSVNFLKAGCVFADKVNTVSPTYAREIQTPEFGCRLEGLMRYQANQGRLCGILNGIDIVAFNPANDPAIPAHYTVEDLSGKRACKERLLEKLGIVAQPNAPLLGMVTRLSSQKGIDLVLDVIDRLALLPAQVVIQGLGEKWLVDRCRQLSERFPYHFRFVEKFDAELAQQIYAGSDCFLMPSAFEPCGLGQLIAMRYGTLPIVRHTGGLADTVHEGVDGFVFADHNAEALLATVRRANFAFAHPERWQEMIVHAMNRDSSWARSASLYEQTYDDARHIRLLAKTPVA